MRRLFISLTVLFLAVGCGDGDSEIGASLVQTDGGDGSGDASDATDQADGTDQVDGTDSTDQTDGTDGTDGPQSCIEDECGEQWAECQANDDCVQLWSCVEGCQDQECLQGCFFDASPEARELVGEVLECGTEEGCFGSTGPECGNGVCEDTENEVNCPADCTEPPTGLEACLNENCGEQVSNCYESENCAAALACVLECGEPQCFQQCAQSVGGGLQGTLGPVRQCANQNECFEQDGAECGNGQCEDGENPFNCPQDCVDEGFCGDGVCDEGENDFNCPQDCGGVGDDSCVGKCGTFNEGAACQCDGQCSQFGDCCGDFEEVCLEDGVCGDGLCSGDENAFNCPEDCQSQMFCGDGVCDGPETAENCPEDCGGGGNEVLECVAQACPDSAEACFGDPECLSIVECAVECNFELGCAQGCFSGIPGGTVIELFQCAVGSGCLEQTGPECGNGQCEEGENLFNCPQDCEDPGGFCGDGICGEDENEFNCPIDCEGGGGDVIACVTQQCPAESAACFADPSCVEALECAADCNFDLGCSQQCLSGFPSGTIINVVTCALGTDCLDQTGPVCGNGQCEDGENAFTCPQDCQDPGGFCGDGECGDGENPFTCPQDCSIFPECGNGNCEQGETSDNCPQDCDGGGDEVLECLAEACSDSYQACFASNTCAEASFCILECGEDQFCFQQCFFGVPANEQGILFDLIQCAVPSGCLDGGGTGPQCGNGQCESGENSATCPEDCESGGQECGDGYCGANETATSCPDDCEASDVCLQEVCPDLYYECIDDPACTGFNDCLLGCNGSQFCQQQCFGSISEDVQEAFENLINCGQQFGCFELNETCGDNQCNNGESETTCPQDCGITTGPVCGNGVCEAGEGPDDGGDCPEDCVDPNGETYECLVENCELGLCLEFQGCTSAFECMAASPTAAAAEECLEGVGGQAGQVLNGVLTCGADICWGGDTPTCGDGICDPNEENAQLCPEDCAPAGPECGNNVCEDGETTATCPSDCVEVDPSVCLFQSCGDAVSQCTTDFNCTVALQCVGTCDGSASCATDCGANLTDPGAALLDGVISCGQDFGCLE